MKEEKLEHTVYFGIYDFECNVKMIAAVLQIDGYKGFSKGELKQHRKDVIRKTGLWEIQSPLEKNIDIEKHINWILDQLLPKINELKMIYQLYNASAELSISTSNYNVANLGLHLDREIIEKINMLEASIDIDIYNFAG